MRGPCLRLAQIGADSKHSRRLAGLPESHYPLGGQSHQASEIHARALDVHGRRHPAPRCHRHCERSEAIQSSLAKSSGLLRCARNDDLQCTGRARGSLRSELTQNIHADWRVCQKVTTRSAVKAIKRPKFMRALSMSTADATRLRGATVIASVAKQSSLLLQRVLDCFAALAMTIYNARAVLAARSDRSRLKTFTPIGGSARKSLPARRSKPSSARNSCARSRCPRQTPPGSDPTEAGSGRARWPIRGRSPCRRSGSDRGGRLRSGGRGLRFSPPTWRKARQSIPRICRPWQSQTARLRSVVRRYAARGSRVAPVRSRDGSRPARRHRKFYSSPV